MNAVQQTDCLYEEILKEFPSENDKIAWSLTELENFLVEHAILSKYFPRN